MPALLLDPAFFIPQAHADAGRLFQIECDMDALCIVRDGLQMDGLDNEAEVVQSEINALKRELGVEK